MENHVIMNLLDILQIDAACQCPGWRSMDFPSVNGCTYLGYLHIEEFQNGQNSGRPETHFGLRSEPSNAHMR